jgi:hypothetical protein
MHLPIHRGAIDYLREGATDAGLHTRDSGPLSEANDTTDEKDARSSLSISPDKTPFKDELHIV